MLSLSDGVKALTFIVEGKFDLMVPDLVMLDMDVME